ncbi:putative membrane protein [Janthinobacterium sp. CG_23.3]|uniref:DUF2269 family protein n=1 Tax=unclassified Janthinobacterium TaxID=2610881 RepID=UPI0003498C23|nr:MULTISPECIES: DUF2269 domain-containing protein [unclassified Janthinobacterium]MEC5159020.1 putative membrane protein [Janthinobacterium sp. CG_S6]
MDYLLVKVLHILSATFLFGTGVGSAFYLLFTSLSRDVRAIAVVTRAVVLADWLFTATTMVLQPLTGLYLAHLAGMPLGSRWLAWSLLLYGVAVACWLPVLWLQIRLRRLACRAAADGAALPAVYWRYFRLWVALGFPALLAFLAIFYLMVVKPA